MSVATQSPRKPKALRKGSKLAVFAPASPSEQMDLFAGIAELKRLGFAVAAAFEYDSEGYFAARDEERLEELLTLARDPYVEGMIATRGGYGSNYLLEANLTGLEEAKCLVGYSDLTSLQVYLWQMAGWVTFHGPMVSAGFSHGAGKVRGYDEESFVNAVMNASAAGYSMDLEGETLAEGVGEGRLLGGCLTLLQATMGTPWELDTAGAILVLEDRGMKAYQVDRALMHLKQARKLGDLRGILLGEFPDGDVALGGPTTREVCERILGPLGVPMVWGAPVGHTTRPMLTLPLGVKARLDASRGRLEILEAAVAE